MQSQLQTSETNAARGVAGRISYLDTLRVLAVLMVFMFHASKAFTAGDWHVLNDESSMIATVLFGALLAPWGMPFFFLLAGAGTWFALQRRSPHQFVSERFKRLLIPYLVGSVLFTPLQAYIEWKFSVGADGYQGTYLQFLFIERFGGWNTGISGYIGYHLWFLIFLFSFSMLSLPLLMWFKGRGQSFVSGLARVWEQRGGILTFALPPLLLQVLLRPIYPGPQNWADFFYDLYFFLAGYTIYADERFAKAIRRDRWLVLITGSIALLGLMISLALGQAEDLFVNPEAPGYRLFWAFASVDAWCMSIVMLYVGMRFLDFSNRGTRYGQEAIVPFYLMHQPVILALAFYVVQWEMGATVKMLVLVIVSFVITSSLYEFIVRRLPPLRAVFGMKGVTNLAWGMRSS